MILPNRALFLYLLCRHFSSPIALIKPEKRLVFRCTNKIRKAHRSEAIVEAKKVLREYLHSTKSLPFIFAELIAYNAHFSLSNLFRKVRFSVPNFPNSLRKLLRYEPINEFEFFLESIGIEYHQVHNFLPKNKFFLLEDRTVLEAAISLSQFGFPWNTLGKQYKEEESIFSRSSDELNDRLEGFKERYGLGNIEIIGACLAFPSLLRLENAIEPIFEDLQRVFVDFEGSVGDYWYEVCCKVRVFYDLGCEKGKVGEFMCENKEAFLLCPAEVLARKAEYFGEFGAERDEVGSLLLRRPEILSLDLESQMISVSRLLRHFGMDEEELTRVREKYSHVFGRNQMANLPSVTRAMNLHRWFFEKLESSDARLLKTFGLVSPDKKSDGDFTEALRKFESSKYPSHWKKKVGFVRRIGFGENSLTAKVVNGLHGNGDELQERFDYLVGVGIEHSKLCRLITKAPRVLSHTPEKLEPKLDLLLGEMGCSLEYLERYPEILCFDLDRIKSRCRFRVWLRESGLCKRKREYSIASILSAGETRFIAFLSAIHPAAPKQYLEKFSHRKFTDCDSSSEL